MTTPHQHQRSKPRDHRWNMGFSFSKFHLQRGPPTDDLHSWVIRWSHVSHTSDFWGVFHGIMEEMWKTHQGLEEWPILTLPLKKNGFFLGGVVDFISKAGNGFRSYNSGSVFPSWDWEILKYWTFSKKPHWLEFLSHEFSPHCFFSKFSQHWWLPGTTWPHSAARYGLLSRAPPPRLRGKARYHISSTYSPEVERLEPEVMMLSKKESPNFQGARFSGSLWKTSLWGKIKSYFRKDVLLNCHLQSGEVVSYSLHSLNLHCQIWFPCDCSLKIVIYCHRLHIYIYIYIGKSIFTSRVGWIR